jgi:transposase
MEYGAIDLHLRRSVFRIEDPAGALVLEGRVDTSRNDLTRIFGDRAPMKILVESSTDSEWVAVLLESFGHEVIVADPSYLPMYGERQRRVKTDQRDVRALVIACRQAHYRRAHRVAPATRTLRQQMRVRRHLVQMRTQTVNVLRALLRQEGLRLPSGDISTIMARLDRVALPPALAQVLQPLHTWLATLQRLIVDADAVAESTAAADPAAQHLMSVPGVGPVIALTYRAVLDTPARFAGNAGRASAFLGLVPSEYSSGEQQRRGHITKRGPRELRALLVQAGWGVWRGRSATGAPLRAWAQALAARRGRRVAIVALARRLSRILFAVWRDATNFTPRHLTATAR